MENEVKFLEVDGLKFYYLKDKILFPQFNGKSLEQFLKETIKNVKFNFNPEQPSGTFVRIPNEIENLVDILAKAVRKLKSMNEYYSATYLATKVFEGLTDFSEKLKNEGLYVHACSYWCKILDIVATSEIKNNVTIHKGHPFFFLAFYYLLSGNLETGFVYAYNAIKEDEVVGKLCPELDYPKKAPIYLTAFLVDNPNNRMIKLVRELRHELKISIVSYNKEFNKKFTIEDFDKKFLQNESNPALKGPRYLFTFSFWSLIEQRKRINLPIQDNEFSKLRNLTWIFNLCLLLDKILEANPQIGKERISKNVKRVFQIEGFMSATELVNKVSKKYGINIHKDDPDKVLKLLLPMNLSIGSKKVPKLAIHFLIAWHLRNYGGHKIRLQNYVSSKFDEILQVLMGCIIHSVNLI